ncbi:MAG: ATP-binding protein, partial [Candidatus Gastranaerophilaceae bacterium]
SLTELKSEIKNLKDEYLNMTEHAVYLASMLKLLQKAKEKFNEEQINVREAEKFLKELTCGKYDKADAEKIEITDENGFSKKYDKLSRGTAEQFYLSLRLGYASNYEKNTKGKMPPPLLVDDAFVNFDKERTERAIGCLYDFSKANQVIYFTCRGEEVCEVLDKAGMPDVTKIYI